MKKTVLGCVLLMMISFGLFAQSMNVTKGLRKIDCQILPVAPFSKSRLSTYTTGQPTAPRMSSQTKSLNWSGYAAFTSQTDPEIGSVTGVWGNWTVPKLYPSLSHRYSACWIGLDGYSNSTVEQIGTEQEWNAGQQVNYVWFSLYPGLTYEIVGFPIQPKDTMRALIASVGNDSFEMILENLTQGVYVLIPSFYTSAPDTQRNSAEWIVEAPSSDAILPLAHFSPVTFSNCVATIRGSTHGINSSHWKNSRITMVTSGGKKGVIKAKPSRLSHDGESFTIKWHHR